MRIFPVVLVFLAAAANARGSAFVGIGQEENGRTVTAVWTGQQRYVTTVTGRGAWECVYDYGGQRFVRVFRDGCPQSIQVQ